MNNIINAQGNISYNNHNFANTPLSPNDISKLCQVMSKSGKETVITVYSALQALLTNDIQSIYYNDCDIFLDDDGNICFISEYDNEIILDDGFSDHVYQ